MKFCPECGKELRQDIHFCPGCGFAVAESKPPKVRGERKPRKYFLNLLIGLAVGAIIAFIAVMIWIAVKPVKTWIKVIPGNDTAFYVQNTKDGSYLIAGDHAQVSKDNGYQLDAWILKLDSFGKEIWSKTYGGDGYDRAVNVKEVSRDKLLVTGETCSSGKGGSCCGGCGARDAGDIWLFELDGSGNKHWSETYGGEDDEGVYSTILTKDGNYVFAGDFGYEKGWLIKVNRKGEKIWERKYKGLIQDILETKDGYVLSGGFNSLWIA